MRYDKTERVRQIFTLQQERSTSRAVRTHIFCASRADWDRDHPDVRFFDERSS
jgi:hypothetical protein